MAFQDGSDLGKGHGAVCTAGRRPAGGGGAGEAEQCPVIPALEYPSPGQAGSWVAPTQTE